MGHLGLTELERRPLQSDGATPSHAKVGEYSDSNREHTSMSFLMYETRVEAREQGEVVQHCCPHRGKMMSWHRWLPVRGHTEVVPRAVGMVEGTTPRQIEHGGCALPNLCQYQDTECFG